MTAELPPPAAVLAALVAEDPGRPRITVYDDTEGTTRGERVELSARVLANWVAKAANLLQDELDAAPGTVVRLDLPPHWRSLYWALAVWSVGATVEVDGSGRPGSGVDILVTDNPAGGDLPGARVVLVTLAALARSAQATVPRGAVDEAAELATHPDVFDAWEEPGSADLALSTPGGRWSYSDVVPDAVAGGPHRWHLSDSGELPLGDFLRTVLAAWAGSGSVVLTRGTPASEVLARRLASEGAEPPPPAP